MSDVSHVLIVDDEESMRDSMSQTLGRAGYAVTAVATGRSGLARFNKETYELVFLDLRLPDGQGLSVLRQMKEASPETPVIVITAFGSIEIAVEAIKLGAFEFLTKPFTPEELRVVTQKALKSRTMVLENILLRSELKAYGEFGKVVGQSQPMQQVLLLVSQASRTDSPVLLTGETGTGKELIAREIHQLSPRHFGPFVAVDSGSLPEPSLEDELFGHVKGAFPGAQETKHGRFELAHGGTIFFDSVSQISPALQGKLFRAIQERAVTRLGHSRPITVDARIMASARVNLAQAVSRGLFREDLFYRMSVVPIHLPPLRERIDDIPLLVEHFLQKYSRKAGRVVTTISRRALTALQEYDWPGNVRELENTIERAVVLCRGQEVDVADVISHGISLGVPPSAWSGGKFKTLAEIEKNYITAVLSETDGNKGRTAMILGIDRKTLWAKLKKYGLEGRGVS
jgi:two-component system, NtrC family, response regulator HydG